LFLRYLGWFGFYFLRLGGAKGIKGATKEERAQNKIKRKKEKKKGKNFSFSPSSVKNRNRRSRFIIFLLKPALA
jgi:hypothetical protein